MSRFLHQLIFRGRFVFECGRCRVLGLSFVFHISDVAVLIGCVGNDLSAAIGQDNAVRPGDDFAVTGLLVSIVVLALLILDSPVEAVWFRGLKRYEC
jgi:hypothetical protein